MDIFGGKKELSSSNVASRKNNRGSSRVMSEYTTVFLLIIDANFIKCCRKKNHFCKKTTKKNMFE
jgi:hypothetical protein